MADDPVSEAEEWRPIPWHPHYEVSTLGRIRSVDRWIITSNGRRRFWPSVILRTGPNSRYHLVSLTRGKPTHAHVIVCEVFNGPRPSKDHEVAHWNGDARDNRPANLRWATRLENAADMSRHGTKPRGSKHCHAKASEAEILAIRKLRRESGLRLRAIAEQFGLSRGYVKDVVRGRSWRHVP